MVGPVYVTGMAWATALGCGLSEVWNHLLNGGSGIENIPCQYPLRNYKAAMVSTIRSDMGVSRRLRQMAGETLSNAVHDAGLEVKNDSITYVLGTSFGSSLDDYEDFRAPLNQWADDVTHELHAHAPCSLVSTACSSGSDAIGLGLELVRSGETEICVCGAFDILTDTKRLGHSTLGTMTDTDIRPFDTRHNGTLLGEGGAAIVLSARRGSGPRHAILLGSGSANDAFSMSAPEPTGLGAELATVRALDDAGINQRDVVMINAHGSGTVG